jgi:hypothetical protein
MGSNDIPPPHVSPLYPALSSLFMATGGLCYTITYFLMVQQSYRDRTYAMPIFSLALNFAWEIVFALFVAEAPLEKTIFVLWMVLDAGLVYGVLKYGKNEWAHAPAVSRNLGKIMSVAVLWCCWALWAISSWWIDEANPVNPKPGKVYFGVNGIDTTELGYWTAVFAQVVLSCLLLAQITVRGNSGGASYSIWVTRFVGSLAGLNVYYGYCWFVWPEAHGYVMHPLSICFLATWPVADLAYLAVLREVKKTEVTLKDGRKVKKEIKLDMD